MDLRQSLASSFADRYPVEVAAALETRPPDEIARVLRGLPRHTAASVVKRISPGTSAQSLQQLDAGAAAGILVELGTDEALPLLRRLSPAVRDAIISAMPPEHAEAVNAVIRYPAGTAGALMDPRVAALPADMEAEEALKAVRREAEHAHDILYVVDREHRLAGALHLQHLLLAQPRDRLENIMEEVRHRLSPTADRHTVVKHAGWLDGHSLPVVDGDDRLLGAVHFRVVRALADELYQAEIGFGDTTARVLGDLFWTGVGGVIDAFAAAAGPPRHRRTRRVGGPPPGESRFNGASGDAGQPDGGEE